jgi:putative membrane protein
MSFSDLPLLNAILNATSTALLLSGFYLIRKKKREAHKKVMLLALSTSVLFLLSYTVYHINVGSVRFLGEGTARVVYFSVLTSHTVLAAAVPFLAFITLIRALKGTFDKHRRIARWTLPIWLYVSATGVVIYLMLYQLYPHSLPGG